MNENLSTEEKNQYQSELFSNRLAKKYKQLRKWARKNRISCYRLYDRDIPEIPLAVDLFEFLPDGISDKMEAARFLHEEDARISANDLSAAREAAQRRYVQIYLYERPYEKDEQEEEAWMDLMAKSAAKTLGIAPEHVIQKIRKKQKGESQYEKIESENKISGLTQESGELFKINLTEYVDSGLFFDHRPLRNTVRTESSGKSVLNLFCYTGSFSVYAAEGRASKVESVDLSNTYLAWAKENMTLNGFSDRTKYIFTKADVSDFLQEKEKSQKEDDRYDIIILDPPTFSNSKMTRDLLDINRDWPELVTSCLNILNPGGTLYFSTNSKRLKFDRDLLQKSTKDGSLFSVSDITESSVPEDYKGQKPHRAWKFRVQG